MKKEDLNQIKVLINNRLDSLILEDSNRIVSLIKDIFPKNRKYIRYTEIGVAINIHNRIKNNSRSFNYEIKKISNELNKNYALDNEDIIDLIDMWCHIINCISEDVVVTDTHMSSVRRIVGKVDFTPAVYSLMRKKKSFLLLGSGLVCLLVLFFGIKSIINSTNDEVVDVQEDVTELSEDSIEEAETEKDEAVIQQSEQLPSLSDIENYTYEELFQIYDASLAKEITNGEVQFKLGYLYYYGLGIDIDHDKAFRLFKEAYGLGNLYAAYFIGKCYFRGVSVEEDSETAEVYFDQVKDWILYEADHYDLLIQEMISYMYKYGLGVELSVSKSFGWIEKSAEQGYGVAENNLGVRYHLGEGVAKSYEKAVEWYKKSADQGYATAQSNLGLMYDKGFGVEQNYELAVEWYKKSADQGYARGQVNLGYMYNNGLGVEQNYELAVEWYKKSADQGNARGQVNLGYMYNNGLGVEQNYELALEWYKKSADQGNARGQVNLGYMYQQGLGVQQNYGLAVEWYKKSADQGDVIAQSNLGYMYEQGLGVEQNYELAVEWYKKAADQGYERAIENLSIIKKN